MPLNCYRPQDGQGIREEAGKPWASGLWPHEKPPWQVANTYPPPYSTTGPNSPLNFQPALNQCR